jgi:hypothetical protein
MTPHRDAIGDNHKAADRARILRALRQLGLARRDGSNAVVDLPAILRAQDEVWREAYEAEEWRREINAMPIGQRLVLFAIIDWFMYKMWNGG